MAAKKKKNLLPQILILTLLILTAYVGWATPDPSSLLPDSLTRAIQDFRQNPKIKNFIDLTGDAARDAAEKAGSMAGKASDNAGAVAKEAGKSLSGNALEKTASALKGTVENIAGQTAGLKETTGNLLEKGGELKETAKNLAGSAAANSHKLHKEAKQGTSTLLGKISTVWHVEETIATLREDPDWLPLEKIPQHTRKALLAIEDHDFYNHGGLDISGIFRAFLTNMQAGEVRQGGSTLTQQMVKNVFLSSEQTFSRKAEEAVLTLWIEHKYSKDEILEIYFNSTYFGAGAYGLHDASRIYLGKAPSMLNLPESAMLAALPYAPSALNPYENPSGCAKRTRLVLREMMKYGYIGNTELKTSLEQGIALKNGKRLLLE